MYGYYGLAAMGPAVQKYLWWKRYLTQFQLVNISSNFRFKLSVKNFFDFFSKVQFSIVISHAFVNLFQKECTYPKGWSYAAIIYTSLMAGLFMNFYKNSYSKSKKNTHSD